MLTIVVWQLLDELLGQDEYAAAGQAWGEDDRNNAVQFWHKLDGQPHPP